MTLKFLCNFQLHRLHHRNHPKIIFSVFRILLAAALFTPETAVSRPLQFLFAADLPAHQKQTVLSDLEFLNRLQFRDTRGSGAKLFGTPVTSQNLKQWLAERSRYIVAENFKYSEKIKVVTPGIAYPNADLLPYREVTPAPAPQGEGQRVVTVMTNTGAQVYIHGKRLKNLLAVEIAGIGPITISSPRTGLFKIGEGLFTPLLQNESNGHISFGNSLRRLAVYFHEARHSDGNGKSLGFLHAPCPDNKGVMAGRYACDRNLNGPYTIEGTFLRSAVDTCRDCSRKEKEALRNVYADKFNRVVRTGTVTDVSEQRILSDSTAETCKKLKVMNVSASSVAACNTQSQPAGAPTTPELRPAWLDERPEGFNP